MANILNLYGLESEATTITGTAGLLCEFAPDSPRLRAADRCYRPQEMLGSADDALEVSYALVSKLMHSVSRREELPILSIFEEPLLEQVSYILQAFHLDRWISSQGFSECRLNSCSPWFDRLRKVHVLSGSGYALTADRPSGQEWIRRGMGKLWKSRTQPFQIFQRIAPVRSRYLSGHRQRRQASNAPRGGVWFYSTSYNYSKIGLEYEPYFPQQLHFLVEDESTGGKCLAERGREFFSLYAWSQASDIPSAGEVRSLAQGVTNAFASAPLSDEEKLVRAVLLQGDWWKHVLSRQLPFLLFHERVLQRWCEHSAPEMLVVGNAGWERALLEAKAAKHIPSIMLQHGIMHWVYAVADQPVTNFLLRGQFFQRLINEKLRQKTVICNYPEEIRTTATGVASSRRDILFITMPYEVVPLFHCGDLQDILLTLLQVSQLSRRRLMIRVHPAEKMSFYQGLVTKIQNEHGLRTEVSYSQGPGVEEVLANSCVAILYFSTMFMDCLRHAIPIISFDWHEFPNKRHFQQQGIFNFAQSLADLRKLIERGIDGKLPARRARLEQFLAPNGREEISRLLAQIWNSRSAVDGCEVARAMTAKSAD